MWAVMFVMTDHAQCNAVLNVITQFYVVSPSLYMVGVWEVFGPAQGTRSLVSL